MTSFQCPYLHGEVELSGDRQQHIADSHPDLLPAHLDKIGLTLADPDEIRRSRRFANARIFVKWYDDLRAGKYVVVVAVTETFPATRHWIVTAYMARRLSEGDVEWKRA